MFPIPLTLMKLKRAQMKELKSTRAFRSTFCPPSAKSLETECVRETVGVCLCVCSLIQWSVICMASQRGLTNVSIGQLSMALCSFAPHLSALRVGQCARACVCVGDTTLDGGESDRVRDVGVGTKGQ